MFPRSLSRLLAVFALLLSLVSGWAAEVLEEPRVTVASATSAVVRWRTDVPTGTRVTYGLSAERLNQAAEGALTDSHAVTLAGLQSGTRYFFAVGTARKTLATGQFSTSTSAVSAASPPSSSASAAPPAAPRPKSLLAKIVGAIIPPRATPAPYPRMVRDCFPDAAPPARQTWGNPGSLADHFARHGGDFAARSAEDYAALAWRFRQRARSGGLLVKLDDDGVQRVFDPASGAFAAYNRDGTTKTFFKPGSRDYFTRQPGRAVPAITP